MMPAVMEILPQKKDGNSTIVTYKTATFDKKIDERIFSQRNLQKGN
jgi:hypothetical protein